MALGLGFGFVIRVRNRVRVKVRVRVLCPAAVPIPVPRARTTGTVTGPVVAAPQSHARPKFGFEGYVRGPNALLARLYRTDNGTEVRDEGESRAECERRDERAQDEVAEAPGVHDAQRAEHDGAADAAADGGDETVRVLVQDEI